MKHLPCIKQYVPVLGKRLKAIITIITNQRTRFSMTVSIKITSKLESQPLKSQPFKLIIEYSKIKEIHNRTENFHSS